MGARNDLPLLHVLRVVFVWHLVQPLEDDPAARLCRLHLRAGGRRMIFHLLLAILSGVLGVALGAALLVGLLWLLDLP